MTQAELLDELRRECPDVRIDYYRGVPAIIWMTPAQLEIIVTKREHAAAERMRVAAADVVNLHETMTGEACGLSAEILDLKLEPEEPSECK